MKNNLLLIASLLCIPYVYAEVNKFSMLTLNTALLAITAHIAGKTKKIKEVGKLKHNSRRAKSIAETIITRHKQGRAPDILVIQEGFDVPVVKSKLVKPFKKEGVYPHHYRDKRSGRIKFKKLGVLPIKIKIPVGANSGLAIFSRFPIKRHLLKDYTCFAGEGAFARKGLLGAELNINGQTVYIFTTHLQAGLGPKQFKKLEKKGALAHAKGGCVLDGKVVNIKELSTGEIRRAELQQAKKWIEQFATDKSAPIIFAGDFNIRATSSAGRDIKDKVFTEAEILYNPVKSRPHTGTVWNIENRTVVENNRIDFMIIVQNPGNILKGDAWIVDWFTPDHTDHLGFYGEFEFDTPLMVLLKRPGILTVDGQTNIINLINKEPKYITIPDAAGTTPLLQAALRGYTFIVKTILQKIERPAIALRVQDEKGNTALHYAAMSGKQNFITELLKKGANLHIKNKEGKTPIGVAHDQAVKDYLKKEGTILLIENYLKVDPAIGKDSFPSLLKDIDQGKIDINALPSEAKKKIYDRYMQDIEQSVKGIPNICLYGACTAYLKKQKKVREMCLFAHTRLSEPPLSKEEALKECLNQTYKLRKKEAESQLKSIEEQIKRAAGDRAAIASFERQKKIILNLLDKTLAIDYPILTQDFSSLLKDIQRKVVEITSLPSVVKERFYERYMQYIEKAKFPELLKNVQKGLIDVTPLPADVKKKLYDRYMQYIEQVVKGVPNTCLYGACSAYVKKQKKVRQMCIFAHTQLSDPPLSKEEAVNKCIKRIHEMRRKVVESQLKSIEEQMKKYAGDRSSLASLERQKKTLLGVLEKVEKEEKPLWDKLKK